nr:MAG TPA: hypothetical protein [Caudoviricetes sp.]
MKLAVVRPQFIASRRFDSVCSFIIRFYKIFFLRH